MLATGDFRFFWPESISDFVTTPSAWDSSLNTGLGQSQLHSLWITSYFNLTAFFTKFSLDWNTIQILFWIFPSIILSFISTFLLFRHFFKDKKYSIISGVVYTLNTYFLMVLTGGQLGVALSYALVPLVLLSFIKLLEKTTLRNAVISGLALGLQVIFDPRIVFITLVATLFYSIFNLSSIKKMKNSLGVFILPLLMAALLNIYWFFPLLLAGGSGVPKEFANASGFEFFSFANFSNAISLLHPNWPENIFGKVYFLDPKFLILPILAFSALLFSKNKTVLYFVTLSLLGIFMAKGANLPLGDVNAWIFENLPGMSIFRDPTKWYILIALSYSILIPYSLKEISNRFKWVPILFILYFIFLIVPITNQFKIQQVPQEYSQLKDFLVREKTFSRTLWIPQWQRFGYFSNNHPAIGREEIFKGNYDEQIEQLKESRTEELLRNLAVKYIIVPFDSQGEIFLTDRKYDERKYKEVLQALRKIAWLKQISGFERIGVFEISNPKDRFWASNPEIEIEYGSIKPTEYKVKIRNAKEGDLLVFSEGFDKNWITESLELRIQSSKYQMLNSFVLPKGDHVFRVYYKPQKYVESGLWISFATLLGAQLDIFYLVRSLKGDRILNYVK